MKPTPETKTYHDKAMGLSACIRTYVQLGMWRDAQRTADTAKEFWIKVEWES